VTPHNNMKNNDPYYSLTLSGIRVLQGRPHVNGYQEAEVLGLLLIIGINEMV
jgi:hypothetical protein